ncbi:MAG: CotH kinase family protein [Bacteroidia bacterium]|nr:CotH kinase family protein [Bacteroidia bacterium]
MRTVLLTVLGTLILICCSRVHSSHPELQSKALPANQPPGLKEFFLVCNPDSFRIIQREFKSDIFLSAQLTFQGRIWKNVRLRLRGDTSREFPEKSLKLKFPESDPFLNEATTVNLNREYLDPTFMRQTLAATIFRESGHPCFTTEHVKIHLNGEYKGLYLSVEPVNKKFLKRNDLSKKGFLYKATRDHACLNYYDIPEQYWDLKNPKDTTDWAPLKQLIEVLNGTHGAAYYEAAKKTFSYKNMVNAIAVNLLIGNRSTNYHNYYVYWNPKSQEWKWLPWDLDKTFILSSVEDDYARGNLSDKRNAIMPSNPFFERALVTPRIYQDIQERVKVLSETIYTPEHLFPKIDSLQRLLAPHLRRGGEDNSVVLKNFGEKVLDLKMYIMTRPGILQGQFQNYPTSFELIKPAEHFNQQVILKWHPAADPNGDPLTYQLCYSPHRTFETDSTWCVENIADTSYTFTEPFRPGHYYFKVTVSDGKHSIRGFDNRVTFNVD